MKIGRLIKIIPRIKGGIGNQLFIYAAARRLAIVSDSELVLDHQSGFDQDYEYQRHYQLCHFNINSRKSTSSERLEPFSRLRRYILRNWSKRQSLNVRRYYQQQGNAFDYKFLLLRPQNNLYVEGYFQSECYFKDVEAVIRNDLKIIPPSDFLNQKMAMQIRSCQSVAVHVRYFDMPHESAFNNASRDYYVRAIAKINSIAPNAHYFVFSDRPDLTDNFFYLPDDRVTFVSHNLGDESAYADLWLMSLCQHFIIANSTFSWWGAWLSNSANKTVVAPGLVLEGSVTSWGFEGLIPDDWIKL